MTVIGRPLSLVLIVVALTTATTTSILGGSGLQSAWAQPGAKPAQPPPPTPAQLEQAKQAFVAGKQLFDAKKYEPAVEKFKESYRLSRNPLLLYNLAFTLDSMGQKDLALFYYKKFLADAPADAAQRAEATPRAAALDKELAAVATRPTAAEPAEAPARPAAGDDVKPLRKPKKPVDPSSFTAADFQHQVVDDAPPGRPLDLTAFSPEDSGWNVTLFYRGHGEAKFHAVPMKPRYNELVGRVPASKLTGVSIQYYIEVRTPDAKIVTRVGKPASPNIVYLDPKARARFYPDLEDSGEIGGEVAGSGGAGAGGASGGGYVAGGYSEAGSTKFKRAKWIATGTGVGLLGVSVTFYLMAASMSSSLEAEAALANDTSECGSDPKPCRRFNDDRRAVEIAGERNELVSRISFGVGLAATGVAAYLWYKEIKASKRDGQTAATTGLDSMVAAPVVGEGFLGGSAALRF